MRRLTLTGRTTRRPRWTPWAWRTASAALVRLADEPPLQLSKDGGHVGHDLAGRGREVHAQVEGHEVPAFALGPLDRLSLAAANARHGLVEAGATDHALR